MRKLILLSILLLLGLTVLASGSVAAQDALPKASDLKAGEWNEIAPGGETTCAYGDAYRFFVHPAAQPSDKLMIYFAGGGACWSGETCSPNFKLNNISIFTSTVPAGESMGLNEGVFDFTNPENPVADYNVVYIPYCTGDIHTGDKVQKYTAPDGTSYTMNFMGYVNATAALDWTYENYAKPTQLFVPGCSAGAYGSIYNAPRIMDHYGDVPAVQFGDAAVGVSPSGWAGINTWGLLDHVQEAMQGVTQDTLSFNDLYETAAKQFPNNQFAEYTSSADQVQTFFYYLIAGAKGSFQDAGSAWTQGMQSNLSSLETDLPNFHAYQAWGSEHCVTGTPQFYTYQVNGVRVRDWLADLVNHEPAANVACKDCETPELYSPK